MPNNCKKGHYKVAHDVYDMYYHSQVIGEPALTLTRHCPWDRLQQWKWWCPLLSFIRMAKRLLKPQQNNAQQGLPAIS